ncbi:MAG: cofactor-independent phosphoglycerate mutase [Dehalococcoidia bacterium]|jgi:2,3-bisphosphoglycerate-independent phosphoglycerate mutase|nr:cofactor-independent phosphoglycerate mutase [Dehalococcoidia bacterium]
MKYFVLIMDGAAGWPLPSHGGKTCLELARTPHLDAMALDGACGLVRTVPVGMEPSSACACMSLLGYDPRRYYRGRGSIEARSMEIPVGKGEAVFRCNLVSVREGTMESYSSGYIGNDEAHALIRSLDESLGGSEVGFFPGISYRHICKIRGHEETLRAACTPAHDIPGAPIEKHLPAGEGSGYLRDLMLRSVDVLAHHPVNERRVARGEPPANMIWLFWGSGQIPAMPSFREVYGLNAALTSGVDLLLGLAKMLDMRILSIPGVTGDVHNDYAAQMRGAMLALRDQDLVVAHVEAPDEAGHDGSVGDKVRAIECIDAEMVSALRAMGNRELRVLVAPDHPTPIKVQTHVPEPVPFLLWGSGVQANGAARFTEREASRLGLVIDDGAGLMARFVS